jgi:hypothetical protein
MIVKFSIRGALCIGLAFSTSMVLISQETQPPLRNMFIVGLEKTIAGREKQPAEQVFKNIQTFKGMPAISVLRIMEMAFVANLGVDCAYCHDTDRWESDVKRTKPIARGMWALRSSAQDEIRKLTGKTDVPVTCYTCHKGQAIPSFAPGR